MFGFYHAYFRAHPGYLVGWDEIVSVLARGSLGEMPFEAHSTVH